MEKLGLNEIRKLFREFYISKGHYPGKSASLIPKDDKSLLLINSGMAPLKPYFAGIETPPAKRMTTCQKCIRTGDIDNVGKTSRHGTFFEMLGNFSFGDYFKEQSLMWGWEFITKVLNMPTEKLWATVYEDDDEAFAIWEKIGMPKERIVRLGKDDNFWEIGLGPCGPCSEIYFDRGEKYACSNKDCKPGCDCDRYIEFWNHVFTQFSKEEDGSYSDLEHPNIDTGMGLERLACIMQGVDSIFDIDTIRFILDGVVDISGIEYEDGAVETDISIRIITDHLRSMVFMIGDGILPSNEGRGYVLRRLIRRAARHGKLLGIKDAFLSDLSQKVVDISGEAYPEISEKSEYIRKIISVEEAKFAQTIDQGCDIIYGYIDEMKAKGEKVLSGEKTFKLYDTYGFPPELTEEILHEKGFSADLEGFNENMAKQKEKARKGRKNTQEEAWKESLIKDEAVCTDFIGYDVLSSDCKLIKIINEKGEELDRISAPYEGKVKLIFDRTPFYAQSGGQIYDIGMMFAGGSEARVTAVVKAGNAILHEAEIVKGDFAVNDIINLSVDGRRRNMIARNHTATHLLHKSLRDVLGAHVHQAGSSVTEDYLRFDFSHFEAISEDDLRKIENKVNGAIEDFLNVDVKEMCIEEAKSAGATALFGEKYGDRVRVVSCGDFSIELCGGTHVSNTGAIGSFRIVSETGVASGVRRIEAVTAKGIYADNMENQHLISDVSDILKCNRKNVKDKILQLSTELKQLRKELEDIKKASASDITADLVASAKEIGQIKLITKAFDGLNINDLRSISDSIKDGNKSIVMVFAAISGDKINLLVSITDDLVENGLNAGKLIKELAKACGGGGGGKADMAQAGGKDPSKVNEVFSLAEELLK